MISVLLRCTISLRKLKPVLKKAQLIVKRQNTYMDALRTFQILVCILVNIQKI